MDLGLELGGPLGEVVGQAPQRLAVDLDAPALHGGQDRNQGALQGLVDRDQALGQEARLQGAVQAQRDVGVLGGVVARLLQGHPVEGDLAASAAGDVLELDGLVAEMLLGQLVHAVVVQPAVERVGQQHGVVDRRHLDPGAGEHDHVVLDVLADLERRAVLEQGLEQRERLVSADLSGDQAGAALERELAVLLGVAVAEGDVAGPAGRQRQGDADQLGAHGVEPRGLGVDRDPALGQGVGHPALQRGGVGDQQIARRGSGLGGLRGGGLAQDVRQAGDDRAELVLLEEALQGIGIGRPEAEGVDRRLDGDVVLELDQAAADPRLLGELDQVLAALRLLDLLGPLEQLFEIAVGLDQLGGGLHADARHAGHVVDRVAGQGLDVDHLLGRHAELLDHLVGADRPVLHRVEHGDALADQLHQVLVRGHDGDLDAALAGQPGVGRDQVVRFVALHLDRRQIERPGRLADHGELGLEVVRRLVPVGLVVGIEVVAE